MCQRVTIVGLRSRGLVVIGQAAAGLAAALTAAEQARLDRSLIDITLIDKALEQEAGGNTRWSPSNMRMGSSERVEPSFVHDLLAATQFRGDESRLIQYRCSEPLYCRIAGHEAVKSMGAR